MSAVLLFVPAAAYSGVTATMVEGKKTNTFFIEGNRLRMEDGKRITIFDGDAKRLITIDPAKRTYGVSTEADMKAMGAKYRAQMQAAGDQMRKQMEKMPPEQRKKLQDILDRAPSSGGESARPMEHGKGETHYQATGAKRTVAGYSCEMYRVVEDGSSDEEQCLIPWSAGVVKKSDLDVLKSFASFMSQMFVGMGGDAPKDLGERALGDLARAPGVPALRLRGGEEVGELKRLERGPVLGDKFAVPAGYTKVGQAHLGGREDGAPEDD